MSGLDKIIQSVLEAAKQEADGILQEADKKAQEILRTGAQEIEALRQANAQKITKEQEKIRQMGEAADKQNRRQALLQARLEVIDGFISAARKKIQSMPDQAYFDMLCQIFVNQNIRTDGEILFSEADKKRLPKDFLQRLNSAANGGTITLATDQADIPDGFVVRCGKIEINCTVDSLLEEKDSILRDRLNQYLSEE